MSNRFRIGGDLDVSRLGFGAMRLPSKHGMGGPARDPEAGRAVLRRAVELGVDHIDTADFYFSAGGAVRANTLIREALHPYPSDLVIATKVGPVIGPDGLSHGAPADMRGFVEANLDGLGVDRLDLVYLRIGAMEPPHGESLAERFEALAALREEGLIRHLGLSNVDTGLARAFGAATAEALDPIPQGYDIAVEATGRVDQLALVVKSLAPEGICESAGNHFRPGELPLLDMYLNGVTLRIARDNVRAHIPDALELAASGKVAPEKVVSHVIDWEDLPTALPEKHLKPVFVRADD